MLKKVFNQSKTNVFNKLYTRCVSPVNGENFIVDPKTSQEEIEKINKEADLAKNVEYFEKNSKHRTIIPLFDLDPNFSNKTFIAPNSTIVGEVFINDFCFIGFNSVIRGDINTVLIGETTCIGDHTTINTVNSLPTGFPSVVHIGSNVTIQNRCSLTSCTIEDNVFIGHGSVILEGSKIEHGAVILPNSVVPPGRIIPAQQVWGGNPVRYVRDLNPGEVFSNFASTFQLWEYGKMYLDTFDPYNYAYLEIEGTKEDADLTPEMIETCLGKDKYGVTEPISATVKNYLI